MSNNELLNNKRKHSEFQEISIEEENIVYKPSIIKDKSNNLPTENVEIINKNLSAAEKMYARHLLNVKKYQRNHPEKVKEKAKKYMEKLKGDKERYAAYLDKKQNAYKKRCELKKQSTIK